MYKIFLSPQVRESQQNITKAQQWVQKAKEQGFIPAPTEIKPM